MVKEGDRRRKKLADQIGSLSDVRVRIYWANSNESRERARQSCLRQLAWDLEGENVCRLLLDTRSTADHNDRRTLTEVLGAKNEPTHVPWAHVESKSDPPLWIADVVAWCYGAGGDWKRRVAPVIEWVTDVG